MEEVRKEIREKAREEPSEKKSVYNYDKICDFFRDYELNKHTSEKREPYIDTDSKYLIRYSFRDKNFIQFVIKESLTERVKGENEEIDIFNEFNLKLHINLPEEDPKMYRLGWQIVVETLAFHNVASFKFVKRGKVMSSVEGQEGKDVTVYVDAEVRNVKDMKDKRGWEFIIGEINKKLICANVTPGKRPAGTLEKPEKYITNCEYISYRYEKGVPPRDPLEVLAIKNKQEIMWEQSVVNLENLDESRNEQRNVSKFCCK